MNKVRTPFDKDLRVFERAFNYQPGLCFLNVLKAIDSKGISPEWFVVHGALYGDFPYHEQIIAHAWLEIQVGKDIWMYDPTEARYCVLEPDDGTLHKARYTKKQAFLEMDKTGTIGPWDQKIWDLVGQKRPW